MALIPQARRVLDAHRDARLAMAGLKEAGRVALGVTQDFADTVLPGLLRSFAVAHPAVRLDLRVGRSAPLLDDLGAGRVDLALVMAGGNEGEEVATLREPMRWMAATGGLAVSGGEVPLAVLDPPCGFRDAALGALARAGRPHRIAATSPSLAGLRAAVRAGIAVTARTRRFAGDGITVASRDLDLPVLPEAVFSLRLRRDHGGPAAGLAALLAEGLRRRGT